MPTSKNAERRTLKRKSEAQVKRAKRIALSGRWIDAVINPNGAHWQIVPQSQPDPGTEVVERGIPQAAGVKKHSADNACIDWEIILHIEDRASQPSKRIVTNVPRAQFSFQKAANRGGAATEEPFFDWDCQDAALRRKDAGKAHTAGQDGWTYRNVNRESFGERDVINVIPEKLRI